MKKKSFRIASWWLLWEDLLFPEPGVEEKIIERARKFKAAGINQVIIFGCHFRWDFIYNWERFHYLLKFIVDTCHKYDIKVFDHHSATLTHRVGGMDEYHDISRRNRHHVPFFPSREFAENLTFNQHKLNDWRMLSIKDGKACYVSVYNAETFCINNPHFLDSYLLYLDSLLETGIDGLMCDDVTYYPRWDACGCLYCRDKFKSEYGRELPPFEDKDFWLNYDNEAFKDWVLMRYKAPFEFQSRVKEKLGPDFPLMSGCSTSSDKLLDSIGKNMSIVAKAMDYVMLEMCGEIVSDEHDYLGGHLPDLALHKTIAGDKPNIGLGYAHNADSALIIWCLNKMFGSSCWISTLTGRLGVSETLRKTIPDEADIIKEVFSYEKEHEDLFQGESAARTAYLFSLESLIFNGSGQEDYSQPWREFCRDLFRNNVQFDVVTEIPDAKAYPLLVVNNYDSVSENNYKKLQNYLSSGGKIIKIGNLAGKNERGRKVRREALAAADFINFDELKDPIVSCPEGWIFRILHDNDSGKYFIHFLTLDITAVPNKNFRNNFIDKALIERLEFIPPSGEITIKTTAGRAALHSPDLPEMRMLELKNGEICFEPDGIKRYMIIELSGLNYS
jgi:hypothetical protein